MSEGAKDRVAKLTSGSKFRKIKRKKQFKYDPKLAAADARFAELLEAGKRPPVDMFGRPVSPDAFDKYVSSSDEPDPADDIPEAAQPMTDSDTEVVRTSEQTSRIALTNMSWNKLTARDIFGILWKVCEDKCHELVRVTVYHSKWGEEHPADASELPPDDADEGARNAIWRRREKEDMKRYFAVAEFANPEIADAVFRSLDGCEIEDSGNYFEPMVVSDDTDLSGLRVRDTCESLNEDWEMPIVDAPQNNSSKPKEEWDGTPDERKRAIAAAWAAGSSEDEIVSSILIASSSGSETEERVKREDLGELVGFLEEEEEEDKSEDSDGMTLDVEFVDDHVPAVEEVEVDEEKEQRRKRKEKKEKEVDEGTVDQVLADPRFADLYQKPGYGVNAADPKFKRSAAMEKFMAESAKRRQRPSEFDKK